MKTLKETIDELANKWNNDCGYDCYDSILEFLDNNLDREFYLNINPNELIHEEMRNQLELDDGDRSLITSGIMECYDFCQQTKGMTEEEIRDFENFRD